MSIEKEIQTVEELTREGLTLPAVLGLEAIDGAVTLARVCAWHSERIPGTTEAANIWADFNGIPVSHGICPTCKASMLRKIHHNGFTRST